MRDWNCQSLDAINMKKNNLIKKAGLVLFTVLVAMTLMACSAGDLQNLTETADKLSEITEGIEGAANSIMDAADTISSGAGVLDDVKDTLDKTGIDLSDLKSEGDSSDDARSDKPLRKAALDSEYYFSKLEKEEKIVYDEILESLNDMSEDVEISTKDEDVIDTAFNAVVWDHPEIFWVKGYTYAVHTLDGEVTKVTFSGSFTATLEERDKSRAEIEEIAKEILAGVDRQNSQYSQVKYIFEYLIDNVEYDLNASNNQDIRSVFLGHRSVCQGYSKATQYLLNELGIFSTLVFGKAAGGDHSWNLVNVDGDYYHLDTTWGDASYSGASEYTGRAPSINYDYFLVTDDEIARTHHVENPKNYPKCNSDVSNYYIKEGLYFTSVDKDQLKKVFDAAYDAGRDNVAIRCANAECLDEMLTYLIEEQHVFDYLSDSDSINYATSPDSFSIILWLE